MVVGWMLGSVGCHAMSKGEELIYKLVYLITATLICPIRSVCPVCPGIIRICGSPRYVAIILI